MKMRTAFSILMFLISSCLWAQALDSNSITVSVSRSTTLRAEQANFAMSVRSGLDSNLTAIVSALTAAGIQQGDFAGVYDFSTFTNITFRDPGEVRELNWQFSYSVPFSKLNETLNSLAASAIKVSSANPRLTMSFSLSGSTVSDASIAEARRKLLPGLMDDARKQAGLLADAGGLAVGQVLAITDGGSYAYSSSVIPVFSVGVVASPNYAASQSITVKFAAGRP